MSNKIIYPLLIIIFSILVIYGIINIINNKKLYNNIESFAQNNQPSTQPNIYLQNNFKNDFNKTFNLDISDNTLISKDFADGTWSIPESIVDSNFNISNLMTININPGTAFNNFEVINNVTVTDSNNYIGFDQNNFNFGTINYNGEVFNINYVLNENIVAIYTKNKLINMHIKLLNKFNSENNILIDQPYYIPETLNAVVSLFNNNLLLTKFSSYKVYNGKVGGEVYRILKAKDIFIDQAPPLFDYQTYNVLMNNYKYPSNDILYNIPKWQTNNKDYSYIIEKHPSGTILVAIQRVFYSPTGNTIKTQASEPYFLNITNGDQIPQSIDICPFLEDKNANSLEKFFKPQATALFVYKLKEVNSNFKYANPNLIVPIANLNLQNQANNMYGTPGFSPQNLSINDLTSLQVVNNNTYEIIKVQELPPNRNDLTSNTTFLFSNILSFL